MKNTLRRRSRKTKSRRNRKTKIHSRKIRGGGGPHMQSPYYPGSAYREKPTLDTDIQRKTNTILEELFKTNLKDPKFKFPEETRKKIRDLILLKSEERIKDAIDYHFFLSSVLRIINIKSQNMFSQVTSKVTNFLQKSSPKIQIISTNSSKTVTKDFVEKNNEGYYKGDEYNETVKRDYYIQVYMKNIWGLSYDYTVKKTDYLFDYIINKPTSETTTKINNATNTIRGTADYVKVAPGDAPDKNMLLLIMFPNYLSEDFYSTLRRSQSYTKYDDIDLGNDKFNGKEPMYIFVQLKISNDYSPYAFVNVQYNGKDDINININRDTPAYIMNNDYQLYKVYDPEPKNIKENVGEKVESLSNEEFMKIMSMSPERFDDIINSVAEYNV